MTSPTTIVPVVLSGGAGTRLWPLSRELYPKQLLPLLGEHTMLQETLLRLTGLDGLAPPLVVCNEAHRFMVAEQLLQLGLCATILLEPAGRNTAPAVALAALQATVHGDDPLLLVLPADHAIRDAVALRRAVAAGIPAAREGRLLTFGIVPTAPETGYGYIRAGRPLGDEAEPATCEVAQFVEKPDRATAERYLRSGEYFWNSGMFLFRASAYLGELGAQVPAMLAACRAAFAGRVADLDFLRLDVAAFASCPADSIDYAVMEKTRRAAMVPLDAGWSDVGSFSALWAAGTADAQGNVSHGDTISIDAHDCYLYAGSRLLTAIGVSNLVVVETDDALLVAAKDRVQDVKQVVERLKAAGRDECLLHRRVNRPWGTYEGVDAGDGFLVKRITVNPGASLSLQRHRQRAEHWVVVRGTARIVCGEDLLTRTANQSVYIPIGVLHRLQNPGPERLEIIEVQTGSYLGEDDIERLEDRYGR